MRVALRGTSPSGIAAGTTRCPKRRWKRSATMMAEGISPSCCASGAPDRGHRIQLSRGKSTPLSNVLEAAELSPKHKGWNVPVGYDYSKPTHDNYAAPASEQRQSFGDFKSVREDRDFDYHGTYSRRRQLYQGTALSACTLVYWVSFPRRSERLMPLRSSHSPPAAV